MYFSSFILNILKSLNSYDKILVSFKLSWGVPIEQKIILRAAFGVDSPMYRIFWEVSTKNAAGPHELLTK